MPYFNLRDIASSFEKGEYTFGVFIDLDKAFNTVDHQILIQKLQHYGTDGTALELFESYNNTYPPKIYPKLSRYYLWCSGRIYTRTTSFPDLCKASNPLMDTNLLMIIQIYLFPIKTLVHFLLL